jgi:hypothetical protein
MTDKEVNYLKEYPLDCMKVSGIVRSKKDFQISFPSQGENGVHIWFRNLALEYVMLH